MKTPSKALINDITRFSNMENAGLALQRQREKIHGNLNAFIDGYGTFDAAHVAAVRELKLAADAAAHAFNRIGIIRRTDAKYATMLLEDMREGAKHVGGFYSGDTTTEVWLGDHPAAETVITSGDRYSRSCKYRKNNAIHRVTVTASVIGRMLA